MGNDNFHQLLQKWKTGKLTAAEEALLQETYGDLLAAEIAKEDSNPAEDGTAEREARIRQKIYTRIGLSDRKSTTLPFWLKIAASVLLLVTVSWTAYHYRYDVLDQLDPVPGHTLTAGADATKVVYLPDGSVVWLNKNSSISYPADFRRNTRIVAITGEAYFQVAHDNNKPFEVRSASLNTKVLGTSFVISDRHEISDKAVTVLTGKVSVSGGGQQLALLTADQQVRFNNISRKSQQRTIIAANAIAFIREDVDFRATPLIDILQAMETRFATPFSFKSEALKSLHFSGRILRGESLTDVLDILSGTLDIRYQVNKDSSVNIFR